MTHWPTLFSVALFPMFVLVYGWLTYPEEQQMLEQFGIVYRTYQR